MEVWQLLGALEAHRVLEAWCHLPVYSSNTHAKTGNITILGREAVVRLRCSHTVQPLKFPPPIYFGWKAILVAIVVVSIACMQSCGEGFDWRSRTGWVFVDGDQGTSGHSWQVGQRRPNQRGLVVNPSLQIPPSQDARDERTLWLAR